MADQKRPPKVYGPVQFATALGLTLWQFERALTDGLLPRRPTLKGWPATLVDDAVVRREEILAAVGSVPDLGAHRAAQFLAGRFSLEVAAAALLELERRGLVPEVGGYKGHPLYSGRALEAFTDREALVDSLIDGRLCTADEAAAHLRVRRSDLDHLTRAGWLEEVTRVHSGWQRRRAAPAVPLYRAGDLDVLLARPAIDWDEVRSTPRGRPSPLARLNRRQATPATTQTGAHGQEPGR